MAKKSKKKEGGNMKITYNVEMPERKNYSKSEAVLAVEAFLESENKRMCLEFKTKEESTKAYNAIYSYKNSKYVKGLYYVIKNGNCVYVEKECKKEQ